MTRFFVVKMLQTIAVVVLSFAIQFVAKRTNTTEYVLALCVPFTLWWAIGVWDQARRLP